MGVAMQNAILMKHQLLHTCQGESPDLEHLPHYTVIIPAYNEEEGLQVVLGKLARITDENYEVIVVDDGSTDRTAEIAREFPCRLISHPVNQGKAAAVRTGITAAHGESVVLIDADDTYPIDVLPEIAQALTESDMVVTYRVDGRDNIPAVNRLGNRVFRGLIRYLYGFTGNDPLTGLYGIRRSILLNMNLDSSGFGVETELAIKAGRMGLSIREIPIRYGPRIGESKLNATSDGIRLLRIILRALALFSPTFFFVLPGTVLFALGTLLMGLLALGPLEVGNITLRANTFMVAAMLDLAGFQAIVFGIGLDLYASAHKFSNPGWATRLFLHKYVSRNIGRIGALLVLAGIGLQGWLGYDWMSGGFGAFSRTNYLVGSSFLAVVGLQVVFSSSFLSVFVSELGHSPTSNGNTR
jgi:glycosyltransferase involved in cell wall biosynthesis